ncbi:MAG TPA: SMP-30/gluconolactonase/LRE family protein [Stellaceae bacterium]|nr:SMP-30/gluconolactonase/LRE family protein [Stellaceae bacterium]
MFAAPPVIETTIFARVPDALSRAGGKSPWVDTLREGAPTPSFLEGPSFDREGNLWVTDIPWGRLFKIAPDGTLSLAFEYDGEPNGLKFHRDGRAFITDHKHGIMVFDPRSGKIAPCLERARFERFKGVNDLVFAANGDLYFTDQGMTGLHDPTGRLWRLRTDGGLDCLLENVPSPNGLALNRAETVLYLCVTRNNAVWRVPLAKEGGVGRVGIFIQMSGGTGPDGMAMDEQDNLAVCHVGFGAVWLFSPLGEPLYRIKSCAGLATTNCAYGGKDRKSLFITESSSGSVLRAELPVAGRPMFSHR